ncbi:glutathione gamma-glutamylcysteinyltransferase [Nostoc sp. CENA543]|uniref:phytochelatin synthase family protein n=1 Tax=Nostoc sp. CENA543 TaxID=1869241 RepID=UPI000CA3ADD5|nr:phytochelatin synthase family protein [Nostoc sp. CENA543]AUS99426.1 glutathione gamma-glutamylcysteinyltransferase [Nostoc sp. CENA543]
MILKLQTSIKTFISATIIGLSTASNQALSQTLKLAPNLVNFNSDAGENLLITSRHREDFFPLSSQFITQNNQAYCGVASIVMVFNSLEISAPVAPQYSPYRIFTQENFFSNPKTQAVITPEKVSRQGITLVELGGLIASYDVSVKVYHAADSNIDDFRKMAAANLQQPGNFVIVNYLRKEINQERGGHISPLAAYNEQTDRFLIMDVSRYKYPPVWVKTTDLWKAMNTVDSVSGKTRGFVFISKSE